MREYIRKNFRKEQQNRENKKITAILQALRNCHRSLGTIQGGEEVTLARHAIAYAFKQVNTLRVMKGKAAARELPPTRTVDVEVQEASMEVEIEALESLMKGV